MTDIEWFKDYVAVSELKARYCRLLDSKDWPGYAQLVTDDFELDVSEGTSVPPIRGRDAALQQIQSSLLNARTAHQVHSPEISFNGDEARAIWAMQDRVVWDASRAAQTGIASLTGYGHYHERYVRQHGTWKIAALRLTRLHIDIQRAQQS